MSALEGARLKRHLGVVLLLLATPVLAVMCTTSGDFAAFQALVQSGANCTELDWCELVGLLSFPADRG